MIDDKNLYKPFIRYVINPSRRLLMVDTYTPVIQKLPTTKKEN